MSNLINMATSTNMAISQRPNPNFLGIASELRDAINQEVLADTAVYHVKSRFVKKKNLRPYLEQWLVPVANTGITRICRKVSTELGATILAAALDSPQAKIIAKVADFDFRPLESFIKTLDAAQRAKINTASQPKLIALLGFKNPKSLDAQKLGRWFSFRNKNNDFTITYQIGEVEQIGRDDLLHQMRRLTDDSEGGADMTNMYTKAVLWNSNPVGNERVVSIWYEGVQRRVPAAPRGTGLVALLGGVDVEMADAPETVDEEDEEDDREGSDGDESLDSDMMSSDDDDIE